MRRIRFVRYPVGELAYVDRTQAGQIPFKLGTAAGIAAQGVKL